MKNENENNKEYVEKTQEELIDKVIAKMEESGATIDGLKRVIAAIERRKKQLNEEERKQDDVDEKIKIVRRTLSSEVKNGIVIAMNEDENGSLSDSVFFAKGEASDVVSMMTMGLIKILYKYDISLDKYVGYLQLVATSIRKEGGMK